MYFLVYLEDLKENRVVKANWIKTLPISNMIRRSVNRNIRHLIFWSEAEHDEPDFTLPMSKENDVNRTCYAGYLVKCFGDKTSADTYAEKKRRFKPAVYVPSRLREYVSDVDGRISQRSLVAVVDPQLKTLMEIVKNLNEQLGPEDLTVEVNDEDADELPTGNSSDHTNNMNQQPNAKDDVVSGNLHFEINAIGGRIYESGVTIRSTIVDLLKKWNESTIYSNVKYDYQFVQFLLLESFSQRDLAIGKLDQNKLTFVQDLFCIRVKNDASRVKEFDVFIARKCAQVANNFATDN